MTQQTASEDVELEDLADTLFALSNARRLTILHEIDEPQTRTELSECMEVSRQAVSKHIDTLVEHGFVRELPGWRESGPVDEFQVDPKRLYAIGKTIADLGDIEPTGGPDLAESEPTQIMAEGQDGSRDAGPHSGKARAHLLLLDGPEAGSRFELSGDRDRWTLGRDEDRDLCLDHDPYISGRQCEVQATDGGHAVVDVFSSNGTFVNFAQLPEGGRTELEPGDVIGVGRTTLVYQER